MNDEDPLASSRGCMYGVIGGLLVWIVLIAWLIWRATSG